MRLVVIDTNVWVSAFLSRKGFPARKGDSDLTGQMRALGVEVITVSHFLSELANEEV